MVSPRGGVLGRSALSSLPASVSVPSYRAADLRAGWVHVGVGRFHRAHQAVYLDELAEQGVSRDWGVVGVGLCTPASQRALARQDNLYTACVPGERGASLRVVGNLQRYLFAPRQRAAVLAALCDPQTRVVSLTVTAPTYLEPARHLPEGVFGLVAEGLRRRRLAGIAPFTVMSCDNIAGNGDAARRQVAQAAEALDPRLALWVDRHVAFPSTMVDRITPPMSEELRVWLRHHLGVDDHCAVVSEAFTQWVVEDAFCNERPPLDEVGVQYVADAGPYRDIKTRLLNASHCALGFLGSAAGLTTTSEAMADPQFGRFVEQLLWDEVTPLVRPPAGVDLTAYSRTVLQRLANPTVSDPLSRLCTRGSIRIPSYVLPSLTDALQRRTPHRLLTLVVAGWVVQLRRGAGLADATDPAGVLLHALASHSRDDLRPLLRHTAVFGSLAEQDGWVTELQNAVETMEMHGVRAAMAAASLPLQRRFAARAEPTSRRETEVAAS